ncbi:helix-turn-helix transcriptional regulator [Paenibacillus arenilitoris]|uniref:Winged helix-turn-helix transcriptional regulator n=1 Tax=Paenibacillus arenilitoris TaxID=2772299 RepID=A0A927CG85_9BACL|nr:winged helix-turn-helix transcriptional regulator [Paenibacillus arenilitoris]MBD2867523.1 winged helix-turn-helix transcriptional regulator [Paenibacillus arenilitoris]
MRAAGSAADSRGDGSTRERILLLLKTNGRMSAGDLSRQLGLTEMAIRRHMYALQSEGSVTTVAVRQAMGRPLHAYELTAEADELFPKNYHLLALDLLSELAGDPETASLVDRVFEGRKKKLLDRYGPRMADKSLGQRVEELAAIQNAGGYMVETEEQGGCYMLHEYNCPIAQVAGEYQQACRCELSLFKALLEAPVERTECLAKGGGKCSYRIG